MFAGCGEVFSGQTGRESGKKGMLIQARNDGDHFCRFVLIFKTLYAFACIPDISNVMANPIQKIEINASEEFPHLPSAPIVEAVIDIRAKSSVNLDEAITREFLEPRLEDYNFLDSQHELSHQVTFGVDIPPQQTTKNAWKGVRFRTADEKNIVQFNRDGFVYSRLAPYQNWTGFSSESLRLWQFFNEMAKPDEINRLGLRFINRIELPAGDGNFENYIRPAPQSPRGIELPFYGFLYQETLAVPGYPYAINLIRTIQPPQDNGGFAVIIDIDVFTEVGVEFESSRIKEMLEQMRWLKNKLFFGSITDQALETFK